MKRMAFAALGFSILLPAQAQQTYHDLDGSGAFAAPIPGLDTSTADEIYVEDGKRYEIYEYPRDPAAASWHRALWKSGTVKYSGSYSFAFEGCWAEMASGSLNTCPAERAQIADNATDRVELAIDTWSTGSDAEELKLDRRRYLSFQLYVHSDTEVPRNWTLVQQVWQRLNATGISPPFAIWVKPDSRSVNPSTDPITLLFLARSDLTDPAIHYCRADYEGGPVPIPAPGYQCPAEVYEVQVQRGEWNRFIIQLQPSLHTGGNVGQVAVWRNTSNVTGVTPDAMWQGPWGYAATGIEDEFDVRVGIYRREQPRRLKLMFDDVRFGSTAASVDY